MNIEEQTKALISSIEKSITDKEMELFHMETTIKTEKAKLKKLKKALCDTEEKEDGNPQEAKA